jgi:4-hydroxythreonine-4-phosphate dehydrogenase
MGCPSGIGPEIALAAALESKTSGTVLVGDRGCLIDAALALGIEARRVEELPAFFREEGPFRGVRVHEVSELARAERRPGRPGQAAGIAQLEYVEEGYRLAQENSWPLATGPVSKKVIAHSGLRRAASFRGHTEWLEALDEAPHSVMCFASPKLVTSLATTHIPIRKVARAVTAELVTKATLELCDLLLRLGVKNPKVAVASLNPHAGEESLLGGEEKTAILPGIVRAARIAQGKATITGPIGAETAYRKGACGVYDGVVAMYHDQATIPMKLLDFGGAVNVTQGLSIVRTSVDHGTAYDIAGKGQADARGMREAMKLARRLGNAARKIPHGKW